PHPSSPRHDAASGPGDDVSNPVLVISSDPLAAALLGAAIELAGHAPRFPQSDESPRGALLRVRPRLVVIDCDHEDACTEAFVGPALMTGSQVLLFRSRRTRRDVSEMVDRLGLRTVDITRARQLSACARRTRAAYRTRRSCRRSNPPVRARRSTRAGSACGTARSDC